MRTRTLFSTTAAAVLLIGAGAASAQSAKDQAAPERAPAAQRNAPAEKMAPSMKAGEPKTPTETTGQGSSESKSGASMNKGGTTGAASKSGSDQEMKSGKSANDKSDMGKKSDTTGAATNQNEMKSGGKSGTGSKAQSSDQNETKGSSASGMKKDESAKDNAQGNSQGAASERSSGSASKSDTTGQGAAGAAKLSTEQRTKITTIIQKQDVKPVNLDISVRVGARVPSTVHFYPLPTQVVEVYPEWRGYYFILVSGDILIIEPNTHEIVAVLAV